MDELALVCVASSHVCEPALTSMVSRGPTGTFLVARCTEYWGGAGTWSTSGLGRRAGVPSGLCATFLSGPLMSQGQVSSFSICRILRVSPGPLVWPYSFSPLFFFKRPNCRLERLVTQFLSSVGRMHCFLWKPHSLSQWTVPSPVHPPSPLSPSMTSEWWPVCLFFPHVTLPTLTPAPAPQSLLKGEQPQAGSWSGRPDRPSSSCGSCPAGCTTPYLKHHSQFTPELLVQTAPAAPCLRLLGTSQL